MTGAGPIDASRGAVAVLLLCKDFARAKTRLARRLPERMRAVLAECMLRDVLAAVRRCTQVSHIVLLTDAPQATRIARREGIPCLPDPVTGHLCASIEHAARKLSADGWPDILVLPTDLPAITPLDIATLISMAPECGVALVADRHGRGTNALLARPLAGLKLHFGASSFHRHRDAARRSGFPVTELSIAGISLDIDTPEDLDLLRSFHPGGHTGRYLAGIAADTGPRPVTGVASE